VTDKKGKRKEKREIERGGKQMEREKGR